MTRRAISKRTRFDVLRRCFFACFYCGLPAPLATLEVDHVVPVARGGADDEWNLVAACTDCNAGKLDGVPLREAIDRAREDWAAYVSGRSRVRNFCYLCGRPVDFDPEDDPTLIPECTPCNAAICDAYEAGVRAGLERAAP